MSNKIKKDEYAEYQVKIAGYAKALSHPARIAIMELLVKSNGHYCGKIVDKLPIAQSSVSQHLKELKESGLISANENPPKVMYSVNKNNWDVAKRVFNIFFDKS